jgi:hypothetical protein
LNAKIFEIQGAKSFITKSPINTQGACSTMTFDDIFLFLFSPSPYSFKKGMAVVFILDVYPRSRESFHLTLYPSHTKQEMVYLLLTM